MAYAVCRWLRLPVLGIEKEKRPPKRTKEEIAAILSKEFGEGYESLIKDSWSSRYISEPLKPTVEKVKPMIKKVANKVKKVGEFLTIQDPETDFLSKPDYRVHRFIRRSIKKPIRGICQKTVILAKASIYLLFITDLALGAVANAIFVLSNYKLYSLRDFSCQELSVSTTLLTKELRFLLQFLNKHARIDEQVIEESGGILTKKMVGYLNPLYKEKRKFFPFLDKISYRVNIIKICFGLSFAAPGDLTIASFAICAALLTRGKCRMINNIAFKALRGPERAIDIIISQLPTAIVGEE